MNFLVLCPKKYDWSKNTNTHTNYWTWIIFRVNGSMKNKRAWEWAYRLSEECYIDSQRNAIKIVTLWNPFFPCFWWMFDCMRLWVKETGDKDFWRLLLWGGPLVALAPRRSNCYRLCIDPWSLVNSQERLMLTILRETSSHGWTLRNGWESNWFRL